MNRPFSTAVLLLAISLSTMIGTATAQTFNWAQWRYLPVLDAGRIKPFDTLAWEVTRTLCNRVTFENPETGDKLHSTALYLTMLLEWQGWDKELDPHKPFTSRREIYFSRHTADKWDRAPLLRVDYLPLREALAVPDHNTFVSPLWLSKVTIKPPAGREEQPFLDWAQGLERKRKEDLSEFEKKSLELARRFWTYLEHRSGRGLFVLPAPDMDGKLWLSVARLMESKYDEKSDPTGGLRKAQASFQQVRQAYLAGDAAQFNRASSDFISAVTKLGPELGPYADLSRIQMEVAYNKWAPFRIGWVLSSLAFVLLLLSLGTSSKALYGAGLVSYVGSLVAMLTGFVLRVLISGRAPVTNMYESVVYVALGVAFLGLFFEILSRKRTVAAIAAAVATLALILADNCPAVLDPSIRPLQPVLRSNFWLVSHVMCVTLSYATFALALGIGNVSLGYYLLRPNDEQTIADLGRLTYRALQVGVFLLAAGTLLGAIWADYSWGRFWGWDPKEVWALIALLGYLAVLHARFVGWVAEFGLAALSVICFSLVVMAWYGVNFVLGTGLHSYGFGGGGQGYVAAALAVQLLYVAVVLSRRTASVRKATGLKETGGGP